MKTSPIPEKWMESQGGGRMENEEDELYLNLIFNWVYREKYNATDD